MFLEPTDGIPTALMLVGARAELEEMRDTTIPGRRANGRGRYRKYDTARMACISGKLLPALMYGKWPSPEDRHSLSALRGCCAWLCAPRHSRPTMGDTECCMW